MTVGYGDSFPVTNQGRMIGMVLMGAGVGLFGVLTSFPANVFLAPRKKEAPAGLDSDDPKTKIAEIGRILDEQEQATTLLRARLEEIEDLHKYKLIFIL